MKTIYLAILCGCLVTSGVAVAQGPPPRGEMGPGPGALFGMHRGKVVAGAAYSADVTGSFVRSLTDGNTIQRTTSGHVARDNDGRTYSQETITGGMLGQSGPTTLIFISDPVGGYDYVLNTTTKIAKRHARRQPGQGGPDGPGGGRRGAFAGPGKPGGPNVVTTDLGTQVVNGVNAQGKSTTRTVPAGAMGNAQPLISTSETWFSPDLQIVVSSKHNDPLGGQSTYALTNIQRSAPSASLFQVPSDYTVQDAPAEHGFRSKGPRP